MHRFGTYELHLYLQKRTAVPTRGPILERQVRSVSPSKFLIQERSPRPSESKVSQSLCEREGRSRRAVEEPGATSLLSQQAHLQPKHFRHGQLCVRGGDSHLPPVHCHSGLGRAGTQRPRQLRFRYGSDQKRVGLALPTGGVVQPAAEGRWLPLSFNRTRSTTYFANRCVFYHEGHAPGAHRAAGARRRMLRLEANQGPALRRRCPARMQGVGAGGNGSKGAPRGPPAALTNQCPGAGEGGGGRLDKVRLLSINTTPLG